MRFAEKKKKNYALPLKKEIYVNNNHYSILKNYSLNQSFKIMFDYDD